YNPRASCDVMTRMKEVSVKREIPGNQFGFDGAKEMCTSEVAGRIRFCRSSRTTYCSGRRAIFCARSDRITAEIVRQVPSYTALDARSCGCLDVAESQSVEVDLI